MDMVERVARKLCKADGYPENIKFEGKPIWVSYSDTARMVIESMRKSSARMVIEGESAASIGIGKSSDEEALPRAWHAMIDAALAPPLQI